MELLYSMFVTWDGALHIQKSSICIGFKVAAVLSDIFLSAIDCTIERKVQGVVKTIFVTLLISSSSSLAILVLPILVA